MRRGQVQHAIFMILAVIVVVMVLFVGYRGFSSLADMNREAGISSFFDGLEDAARDYSTSGSHHETRMAVPEGAFFCVFNTAAEADCIEDYSNPALCEQLESFWNATHIAASSDNVILSSGETRNIPNLVPRNGKYACFDPGRPYMVFEGTGSAASISPMREVATFRLEQLPLGSNPDNYVLLRGFSPNQGGNVTLFWIDNSTSVSGNAGKIFGSGTDVSFWIAGEEATGEFTVSYNGDAEALSFVFSNSLTQEQEQALTSYPPLVS